MNASSRFNEVVRQLKFVYSVFLLVAAGLMAGIMGSLYILEIAPFWITKLYIGVFSASVFLVYLSALYKSNVRSISGIFNIVASGSAFVRFLYGAILWISLGMFILEFSETFHVAADYTGDALIGVYLLSLVCLLMLIQGILWNRSDTTGSITNGSLPDIDDLDDESFEDMTIEEFRDEYIESEGEYNIDAEDLPEMGSENSKQSEEQE